MGRLHARTYAAMPEVRLVGVYDVSAAAARAVAGEFGGEVFEDLDALAGRVRAVTIAVPTEHHAAAAEPFLKRGVACLIEKPLARDAAEGRAILELAKRHGALVQVGHVERYNPAVVAVAKLGLRPRYIETLRVSPLPFRSLDVGVVLDIMIHDIDIVLHLVGGAAGPAKVERVEAVGAAVVGAAEDACNARLTFADGCVASLSASRLALRPERRLRLFAEDAFVSVDYAKRTGTIARREGNVEAIRAAVAAVKAGTIDPAKPPKFEDLVKLEPLATQEQDQLRAQAEAFLAAIQGRAPCPVPAESGLAAVEVAREIQGRCLRAS